MKDIAVRCAGGVWTPHGFAYTEATLYSTRCAPVCFLEGIVEVVDDGHVVFMLKQTKYCMRACTQAEACQNILMMTRAHAAGRRWLHIYDGHDA